MRSNEVGTTSGRKKTWHRVLRTVLVVLVALTCALGLGIHLYASNYYHALPEAAEAEATTSSVRVGKLDNGDVTFVPTDAEVTSTLVFYPGGKVEADAYAPLLKRLADKGMACVLVRMPENLAVLAPNRAARARAELEQALAGESSEEAGPSTGVPWLLAGHSLGGAMAATYASGHADQYQGLVLLAAYSTADLSQAGIKVLSIYGSNDGVLNRNSYRDNWANLPDNTAEYVIDGGIHSYFGTYGHQEGDGEATIGNDEQLDLTADAIAAFAEEL